MFFDELYAAGWFWIWFRTHRIIDCLNSDISDNCHCDEPVAIKISLFRFDAKMLQENAREQIHLMRFSLTVYSNHSFLGKDLV